MTTDSDISGGKVNELPDGSSAHRAVLRASVQALHASKNTAEFGQ